MTSDFHEFRHIEVVGDAILPIVRAITAGALTKSLLNKFGLGEVEKGQYYPLSSHLAMLADVDARMPTVLRIAGELIASEAIFPPEIQTFEHFLQAINAVYLMQHRGYEEGEIGQYKFSKESDTVFIMVDDIPYPCRFDAGMYLGFAKRFGVTIDLEHLGDSCRRRGDKQCTFRIAVTGQAK